MITTVTQRSTRQFYLRQVSYRPSPLRQMKRYPSQHVKHRFLSAKEGPGSSSKNMEKSTIGSAPNESVDSTSRLASFWKWYLGPKPMPERWTLPWYREMVLISTVFAITGSSTMVLVSRHRSMFFEGIVLHFLKLANHLSKSCHPGPPGSIQGTRSERQSQGWSVVISNLLYSGHDSHLCNASSGGRHDLWTTPVF